MKKTRKILSLVMAVLMLCSCFVVANVQGATFNDINQSGVFVKQQTNYTCTLAAAVMLVRRTAMAAGNNNWGSITESAMRGTAWLEGSGLYYNFTYAGVSVGHSTISSNRKSSYINLLKTYPQGVVAWNSSQPHAVLLTDYDAATDTFYCADPAGGTASGRIPLAASSIKGSGQDGKINNLDHYWYVKSPSVSISTTISLKLNNSSNNISNTNDIVFSWSNISGNYHGYNLFVAKNIEGTVNYDWDNSRIYLPGLETISYTAKRTTLPAGAYAAYVEGINITNGQKSQASNFIYFTVYDEIISDFHEPYNGVTIDASKNKSFLVRGWAVNTGKKETKCYAVIDGSGEKILKAVARNDVYSSTLYSSYCFSNMVGFEDYINIENLSSGKHNLKVIARSSTATKEVASIEFTIIKPSFTVNFSANGGSISTNNKTVTYGDTYGNLPTPTHEGYTFDGWYTSATGGTKVTASTKVTATSNHTLYAHWTCNHSSTEVRNAKSATCTEVGFTGDTYCNTCSTKIKAGSEIEKLTHTDADSDYTCDNGCGYEFEKLAPETPSTNCSCNCHKGGIVGFFFKLINFFEKIFGINKVCACGVAHY